MNSSTLLLGLILPFLPLSSYAATETETQRESAIGSSNKFATFVLRFDPASLATFLEAETDAPSDPLMAGFIKDEYLDTALRNAVIFLRDYRTVILHMAHPDADIDEYSIEYPDKELVRIRFSGSMTKHADQWCRMLLEPPSLELLRLHPDNDALLADRSDSGEIRHIPEGYRLIGGNGSQQFLVETPETAKKHGRYLSENDVRDAGPCFFLRGFYINLTPDSASKLDKLVQETKTDRFAIVLNNYVLAAPKVRLLPDGCIYVPDSSLNREMALLHGLYSPKHRHANSLRFTVEQEPVLSTIQDEDAIFTWDGKPLPGDQTASFVLKITDSDSDGDTRQEDAHQWEKLSLSFVLKITSSDSAGDTRQEDAHQWVKLSLSFDAELQDNVAIQPEGRDGLRVLLRRDAAGKADTYRAALLNRPLFTLLRVHPDNDALMAHRGRSHFHLPEGYCILPHTRVDEQGNSHREEMIVELPQKAKQAGLLISEADIADAQKDFRRHGYVNITFTDEGARKMETLTSEMRHGSDRLAIVFLGRILTAPTVQSTLLREIQISGLDEPSESERIARLLSLKPISLRPAKAGQSK